MKTIGKLRLLGCPDDCINTFINLPTTELTNDAIVGSLIVVTIKSDAQALQFCDVMDKLVDSTTSKTHIEVLRNGN